MAKESQNAPQKENVQDMLKKYKQQIESPDSKKAIGNEIPKARAFNPDEFERTMSKETDPDLMTSYEIVKLPSKGLFYQNGLSEVAVEYMTSRDEDLLTTPSLIENGTVIEVLLKRKIKTPNVNIDDLLTGDRSAIILFLRTSSYGADYSVNVPDPRTGIPFKSSVNLLNLRYKEVKEMPDEFGHFTVEIPMRKKTVTFKLLTSGEENMIYRKAQALQEAYGEDFNHYATMKLKAHVVAINEKTDRSYIDKFIDAMPALDAFTIRKKIIDVSPDVDMSYEFMAKDGYKFLANLTIGIDFFFPST